ncbi:MAG: Fur family transcriptional regulator [Chloroflexi bacterium]|nr:Fur family transcriptional regulator [Chloroflexota bacterium]
MGHTGAERWLAQSVLGAGHRLTRPRRLLLSALAGLGDQFTAEELAAAAPGVGRATVFRTLRLMLDLGIVCQVVLDDGALHYRLTSGGHHHHISCSECGAVIDFATCDIDDLLGELSRRTGYAIEAHRLEVYGRCADCGDRSQDARRAVPALA